MAVTITGVEPGSRAQRLGIQPGDVLVSLNGHEIVDVLDYRFFETEKELRVRLTRAGKPFTVDLAKPQYASLGLEFETYLMDRQRSCRNKCVFCFIDQLPKGMRETLYFKDDDDRLSFLFGNYITLTNIDDREIDRILQMRISPINVSVHTMDPELRCKMMGNRFAGDSLRHLYRLAEGGIRLNCQIVLCPGLNDGAALELTLEKLFSLGEGLLSVACVPVGLTRYREGLYPLTPFDRAGALQAVAQLERWGESSAGSGAAARSTPPTSSTSWPGCPSRPWSFTRTSPRSRTAWACSATWRTSSPGPSRTWTCPMSPGRSPSPPGRGAALSSRRCLTDAAGNAII